MRKTKIICTLGPSTDNPEILREMMKSGMNVARMNFSHGIREEQLARVAMFKEIREELNLPVALLLDTKGPEVRVGTFSNGPVTVKAGQHFTLTTDAVDGDSERASITFTGLPADVSVGTRILIDDGLIEMRAVEVSATDIVCEVINGGVISNRKGVNVPGVRLSMNYISEKDRDDLLFGIEHGFDYVAASFATCEAEMREIRAILDDNGGEDIQIIAKIENREGVDNVNEILSVCDGIMVARGDMGVEIDFEELPVIQKKLISTCHLLGKKVITATQMLESMTKNPRPTRAETSDVANAVYDGTSAVMLSGETAAGLYPVESVRTMAKIALTAESNIHYIKRYNSRSHDFDNSVTHAICHAACTTAHDLGATAILAVTKTGRVAYTLSSFRPLPPLLVATTNRRVYYQLALSWGVIPLMTKEKSTPDIVFDHTVDRAIEEGLLKVGDMVVMTGGSPVGISGTTNLMKVHVVE